MKKVAIGCLTAILIFVIIMVAGILLLMNAPELQKEPQIKEAEFPFIVEYEMNGETHVIEDTIVCKFTGHDYSGWFTKRRTWDTYLKSKDEEKTVILQEENSYSVLKPNRMNDRSRVVLNYDSAEYYMGDPNQEGMIYAKPFFYYSECYSTDEKTEYNTGEKLYDEQLERHFGIKIKRFEFSEPIKNKFK